MLLSLFTLPKCGLPCLPYVSLFGKTVTSKTPLYQSTNRQSFNDFTRIYSSQCKKQIN